eukprot:gene9925-12597_t
MTACQALAGRFHCYKLNIQIVQIMIKCTGCITSTAYTCYNVIRILLAGGRANFCSQHFHTGNIRSLTFNIKFTHVHNAFNIHQSTNGRRGNTMLSCTGFCHYTLFSKTFGQKYLSNGIVNLMSA